MIHRNDSFSWEEKNLDLLGTKDFRLGTGEKDDSNITITFKSCYNRG